MQKPIYAKVIIIGDGGVGKSTMLCRYREDKFNPNTEMTYGVDIFMKKIEMDEYKIMLQIWDFGGQDQFQFLHESRILGIKGAILMFDLSRIATLNRIDEWVSLCRKFDTKLPILFVGSKSDLAQSTIVYNDLIKELMERFDLFDYIEISARNGTNIPLVFKKLIEKIIENSRKIKN